jgi:Fe-S-cluster containining protein
MRAIPLSSPMPATVQNCTPTVAVDPTIPEPAYFFADGVRFACQRCGQCCTGGAGVVRVSPQELARIALFLTMPEGTLAARSCRLVDGELALKEKANGDCIFHDGGCSIYPVRPAQCRTFPFWLKNLRNEQAWQDTASGCPGIGQGEVHDLERVLEQIGQSPV